MQQDPQHKAYKALDKLLTGVGLLPVGEVMSRPVLHKAVVDGTVVIDEAVREGTYVPRS